MEQTEYTTKEIGRRGSQFAPKTILALNAEEKKRGMTDGLTVNPPTAYDRLRYAALEMQSFGFEKRDLTNIIECIYMQPSLSKEKVTL